MGSPPPARKVHWLLYALGALLAFGLVIVATVALTLWWIQRPIRPVVLTPPEKSAVEAKIRYVEEASIRSHPADRRSAHANESSSSPDSLAGTGNERAEDRPYVPGAKVIQLTEREINGLLNANTDLGKSVRLEFARDAVNAYLAVRIPEDFPIGAGKMFRARGRFLVSLGNGGSPYAILEDVTIFGVSLPKAWLGGIKGENLLDEAVRAGTRGPILQGVKSLRVEPGKLVLELED